LAAATQMTTSKKLEELGVIVKDVKSGCKCSEGSRIYTLPRSVNFSLGPIIEKHFGKLAVSFEKTGLLKVHRDTFIITAVRKLKQIRFMLRKNEGINFVGELEEAIVEYMENK
jgi:hypothetical protein